MPFRTHPELDKLFRELPVATCAACLLRSSDLTRRDALIDTFEQLALKAGYLTRDTCEVCHTYKLVIRPA
jgi:hypothetical protein